MILTILLMSSTYVRGRNGIMPATCFPKRSLLIGCAALLFWSFYFALQGVATKALIFATAFSFLAFVAVLVIVWRRNLRRMRHDGV